MPWKDILWNYEEDGNVAHVAENGLSVTAYILEE